MGDTYRYKLRAECLLDVERLVASLAERGLVGAYHIAGSPLGGGVVFAFDAYERTARGPEYSDDTNPETMRRDRDAWFAALVPMTLDQVRGSIADVPNGHVMAETLAPFAAYTGKRAYEDVPPHSAIH
jgi:hypothetical protein